MFETNPLIVLLGPVDKNDGTQYPAPAKIDFDRLAREGAEAFVVEGGYGSFKNINYENPLYRNSYQKVTATKRLLLFRQRYDPGVDEQNYELQKYQLNFIREVTNGYKPNGIMLTMDRFQMTGAAGNTVPCTPVNLRRGVSVLMDDFWKKMGLVCMFNSYSAFLDNAKARVELTTWLDNNNTGDRLNHRYPLCMSLWKKTMVTVQQLRDVVKDIPIPTAAEEGQKLTVGNTSWSAWEIAVVKHPAVCDANGLMTPFKVLVWRYSAEDLYQFFNTKYPGLYVPGTSSPDEPQPEVPTTPGSPVDLSKIEAVLARIANDVSAIRVDVSAIRGELAHI